METSVEHFLTHWGYLAIFVATLVSAMGLPVGAEAAIIYGGVLSSAAGTTDGRHLNLIAVIAVAVAGELVGSYLGYGLGYLGGRPLVDRVGKYVLLTHKDLDRAEAWFARRGDAVVFFGRFIPLVRSFISFAAGIGEMALGKFTVFTLLACTIWCVALAGLGHALAGSYQHVMKAFSYVGYAAAAVLLVVLVVLFVHRIRVVRAEHAARREADEPVGS